MLEAVDITTAIQLPSMDGEIAKFLQAANLGDQLMDSLREAAAATCVDTSRLGLPERKFQLNDDQIVLISTIERLNALYTYFSTETISGNKDQTSSAIEMLNRIRSNVIDLRNSFNISSIEETGSNRKVFRT